MDGESMLPCVRFWDVREPQTYMPHIRIPNAV